MSLMPPSVGLMTLFALAGTFDAQCTWPWPWPGPGRDCPGAKRLGESTPDRMPERERDRTRALICAAGLMPMIASAACDAAAEEGDVDGDEPKPESPLSLAAGAASLSDERSSMSNFSSSSSESSSSSDTSSPSPPRLWRRGVRSSLVGLSSTTTKDFCRSRSFHLSVREIAWNQSVDCLSAQTVGNGNLLAVTLM